MSRKKGAMEIEKIITLVILLAVAAIIVAWVIPKYLGGGAKGLASMGPDFITQCQSKGELEKAGVGKAFVDDDLDGSPNHCDICRGSAAEQCDDGSDSDGDGMPDGCDEADQDPKKTKCVSKGSCKCNILPSLG